MPSGVCASLAPGRAAARAIMSLEDDVIAIPASVRRGARRRPPSIFTFLRREDASGFRGNKFRNPLRLCRAPVKTPFHQSTTVSRYRN
eukprot:scaffold13692_cov113-Isochrysis_galbana.AAC.3